MSLVTFQVRIEYELDVLADPDTNAELQAFIKNRVRAECAKLRFPWKDSYITKVLPTDLSAGNRIGRQDVQYNIEGETLELFNAAYAKAAGGFFAKTKLKRVLEHWDVPTQ